MTKVALASLNRAREAEPTFASAWNRATGPFHQACDRQAGGVAENRSVGPALFYASKNAQTRKGRSVRAVVKGADSRTMRPFRILLRMRITRIKGHEYPSIISVARGDVHVSWKKLRISTDPSWDPIIILTWLWDFNPRKLRGGGIEIPRY